MGEEWEDGASRELLEETGLIKAPDSFQHVHTLNSKFLDYNYHNISCIMYNEVDPDDLNLIRNTEPHKCVGWKWMSIVEVRGLIDKLFYPLRDFLGRYPELRNVAYLKGMIKKSGGSFS